MPQKIFILIQFMAGKSELLMQFIKCIGFKIKEVEISHEISGKLREIHNEMLLVTMIVSRGMNHQLGEFSEL